MLRRLRSVKKQIKNTDTKSPVDSSMIFFVSSLRSKILLWKVLFFLLLITVLGFALCKTSAFDTNETLMKEDLPMSGDIIADIYIDGVITSDKHRDSVLDKLLSLNNIKAVVVNINSPGGTITGSEILYRKLRAIAAKKPVVSVIYDLGASGGYMTAIGSDYIIAHATSITGSIGVLMQSVDATDLSKKIGFSVNTYKSSKFKGAPHTFERTAPEVQEYIQSTVDEGFEFFKNLVMTRRGLSQEIISTVANGKIFSGTKALEYGLVDEIGDKASALEYLNKHNVQTTHVRLAEVSLKEEEELPILSRMLGSFANAIRMQQTAGDAKMYAIAKF